LEVGLPSSQQQWKTALHTSTNGGTKGIKKKMQTAKTPTQYLHPLDLPTYLNNTTLATPTIHTWLATPVQSMGITTMAYMAGPNEQKWNP